MDTRAYFHQRFQIATATSPIYIAALNRLTMANCLAELGFNVGAEVGVAAGDHSLTLVKANPHLKLHCIDPWKNADGFLQFKGERLRSWKAQAYEKLLGYNVQFFELISLQAAAKFRDGSFDFVYIDGAHDFRHIAEDVYEWYKKVRTGGLLFGHDFVNQRCYAPASACHVKAVVEAFANVFAKDLYILGPEEGDRTRIPSWMIIK